MYHSDKNAIKTPMLEEIGGIVEVVPKPDGTFIIRECCDGYFETVVTREQLIQIADELRAAATSAPPPSADPTPAPAAPR